MLNPSKTYDLVFVRMVIPFIDNALRTHTATSRDLALAIYYKGEKIFDWYSGERSMWHEDYIQQVTVEEPWNSWIYLNKAVCVPLYPYVVAISGKDRRLCAVLAHLVASACIDLDPPLPEQPKQNTGT